MVFPATFNDLEIILCPSGENSKCTNEHTKKRKTKKNIYISTLG